MFSSKTLVTCMLVLSTFAGLCWSAPSNQVLDKRQSDPIGIATATLTALKLNTGKHLAHLASLDVGGSDLTPAFNSLITEVKTASSIIVRLPVNHTKSDLAGEAWAAAFVDTLIGLKAIRNVTSQTQTSMRTLDNGWIELLIWLATNFPGIYDTGILDIIGEVLLELYPGLLQEAVNYIWDGAGFRK